MLQGLRANWSSHLLAIQRSRNEISNQILIRDSKGLTEDQIKEYRQSFDHFDRVCAVLCLLFVPFCYTTSSLCVFISSSTIPLQDGSGYLDKNEYRSCLLSLGYKLGSDPVRHFFLLFCSLSLPPCDLTASTIFTSSQTDDPMFEALWLQIDPNETGSVPFEAFLDFMTKQMVDQDTADQVLNSFKVLAGDKVNHLNTAMRCQIFRVCSFHGLLFSSIWWRRLYTFQGKCTFNFHK